MKKTLAIVAGLIGGLSVASGSIAEEAFADRLNGCVDKFVHTGNGAKVVLECMAKDGKVTDCKVVENTAPSEGFDKAALCVADYLPMGAKTGSIRLPIMFPAGDRG